MIVRIERVSSHPFTPSKYLTGKRRTTKESVVARHARLFRWLALVEANEDEEAKKNQCEHNGECRQ